MLSISYMIRPCLSETSDTEDIVKASKVLDRDHSSVYLRELHEQDSCACTGFVRTSRRL
jgi:hypothetical protein